MNLRAYLARLYDTILSRGEIVIERLDIQPFAGETAIFAASLSFFDGSKLIVEEEIREGTRRIVEKVRYKYHYQSSEGELIFRYDNAPHHPGLRSFPHHKHEGGRVIEAGSLDLGEVLREIDKVLYIEHS